jgi:EAL domain-containing protein (putative c-di-GMP-specific phosphodiesterase class I)
MSKQNGLIISFINVTTASFLSLRGCVNAKQKMRIFKFIFYIIVLGMTMYYNSVIGNIEGNIALIHNQISSQNLEIEITESVMLSSVSDAKKPFKALKDMGIKIALDDFGTGYTSLNCHVFKAYTTDYLDFTDIFLRT